MDFRKEVSLREENDLNVQGNWIPVTPEKPVQTTISGRTNWHDSAEFRAQFFQMNPTSNGAAACLNSISVDQNRGFNNWEAVSAGHIVGSYAQAVKNASARWNNITYENLLATAEAGMTSGASVAASGIAHRGSNNAVRSPFFSMLNSQIESSQQQSNFGRMLLADQNHSISSYLSNQNQIPCYGFPVPYHRKCDLNSPHKTIADAVSNGTISFQFAPVTPDKGKEVQNRQYSEIENGFLDERSKQEKNIVQYRIDPKGKNAIELQCEESLLQPVVNLSSAPLESVLQSMVDSSSAALSIPSKENNNPENVEENGIDLNKAPEQKPKRKKHRPRVVIEGKPKRAPKSTVKQASTQENPSRRKYVRKNGIKASNTPSADIVGESTDPIPFTYVKSCKRSLNFNLEGPARDEDHGTTLNHQEGLLHSCVNSSLFMSACNFNSEPQAQDLCSGTNGMHGTKSTLQLSQGQEVQVENSPAGMPFDLNRSLTQMLDDYSSLPEKPTPTTPQPTRIILPRENFKIFRNVNDIGTADVCQHSGEKDYPQTHQHINAERIGHAVLPTENGYNHKKEVQSKLQSSSHSISKGLSNCNHHVVLIEDEQAKRSKRGHCHTTDEMHLRSMNQTGPHFNSLPVNQEIFRGNEYHRNGSNLGPHFPEIYKKRKTEAAQNKVISSTPSSVATMGNGARQAMAYSANHTNPNLFASQANSRWSSLQSNNAYCAKNLTNGASNSIHNLHSQSMAARHYCQVQSIPSELLSRIEALSGASLNKMQASEFMRTIGQTEIKMKKISQGPTQVHDLASLTANAECNSFPSTPPKMAPRSGGRQVFEIFQGPEACIKPLAVDNHAKKVTKKQSNKELALVKTVSYDGANEVKAHGHEASVYDHHQSLTKSRDPLEVARPFNVAIDEIIQRLNCLSISGGTNMILAQEQKALVPFGGDGQMIPYEGLFDPTKKRRPRPKVDLDQETDRVWKLLMGKESNNGVEGTDADKEKWWEEERRVFRGRADSFIARMHLIQGDRRFSQWNGSVVDSVIGVFLTQNVSDHLSSSAYMSLAARFPPKSTSNNKTCYKEGTNMYVEEPEVCILDSNDTVKWQKNTSREPTCDQGFVIFQEAEHMKEREMGKINESYGRNTECGSLENSKGRNLDICENKLTVCHELLQNRTHTTTTGVACASFVEADRMAQEDLVSSQSSDVSSQNSVDSSILRPAESTMNKRMENANSVETKDRSTPEDVVSSLNFDNSYMPRTTERIGSCSDSNSETEDPISESKFNSFNGSTSFMELLHMAGTTMLQENYNLGSGGTGLPFIQGPIVPSSNYSLHITPNSGVLEVECPEVLGEESRFSLPVNASGFTQINNVDCMSKRIGLTAGSVSEPTAEQKVPSSGQVASAANPYSSLSKQSGKPLITSGHKTCLAKQLHSCHNLHGEVNKTFQHGSTPAAEPKIPVDTLHRRGNSSMQQGYSNLPNFPEETFDVLESTCLDKQKPIEIKVVESNSKEQIYSSERAPTGATTNTLKAKAKLEREKKKAFDWDSLRKEVFRKGAKRERSNDRMDSLDWEAVRCADVKEIAETIKERGMNNMLAERIKDFLNRCVREHGHIDLEWLRDVPPDKAKEYLLSIRGLGLKSVECVRLLTLHHLAFPVDTNVGRIAVRLGWVPLQPLPESLQLHLLELYPVLESIQKYLWPRLCTLDQRTLYELHYQMITFGKVFCTKSKPNCNACPMRAECKHFASAFASARLALPGPEEKGIVSSTAPITTNQDPAVDINPVPFLQLEANMIMESRLTVNKCEPIIEVPASPEPECADIPESDIEDAFYEDPNEIPTIKLNIKEFAMNLQSYMQENMELQEVDMSKALVALTPEAASIPTPKLKSVSRLRTEHQVYELPDSHPLLKGVNKRVPGDICSYLLAIWTPGETAESIQPPERCCCGSQTLGDLCKEKTCFSCNSIREANSQKVRGTLLIPCKTAMRGSFPLNGTYFQVNEVFADHDSSLNPIDVPRAWIWNLPRRTVLFGTSIPTIFKGQSTQEIQSCFWKGYVCVRGFDQKTRAPRPLMARLHFPASKLVRTKTKAGE